MASWLTQKDELKAFAKSFDKQILLASKDNWVMWLFAYVLVGLTIVFTLGFKRPKAKENMDGFAVTFGPLQLYPPIWSVESVRATIPHEARHTFHCRVLGLWISPWIGLPLYGVIYLLLLLPVYLAFGRFFAEYDADKAGFTHAIKEGSMDYEALKKRAIDRAILLSEKDYVFAVPYAFSKWMYKRLAENLAKEFKIV